MNDLLIARRKSFILNKSFLNIVPNSQFNFPSFGGNSINGIQKNSTGSIFLVLGGGTGGTTPPSQARIYAYSNAGGDGIIEKQADLSYLGSSNELNFEVGGVRQILSSCLVWNVPLGKAWVNNGTSIAEFDLNLTTLTASFVKYKTLTYAFTSGAFYFSPDGTMLFASNQTRYTKYILSVPFDISTAVLSISINSTGFTSPPVFYGNGYFAISTVYRGGSGQAAIQKRNFSVPYDYTTLLSGYGYIQQFIKTGVIGFTASPTTPIFLSNSLKRANYFSSISSSGGRIGLGTFDIPASFVGNGNDLGGVKVGSTIVAP